MEEARSNSGSLVLIIKLSRKPFKTLGKISEKSNEQILRKDGTCLYPKMSKEKFFEYTIIVVLRNKKNQIYFLLNICHHKIFEKNLINRFCENF